MRRPEILVVIPLVERLLGALRESYVVHYAPEGPKDSVLGRHPAVKAVVTNGSTGFSDAQMAQLPELAMVCCFGAGYEGVDLKAAQRRDIEVTHAPGANDATVADHALALALGLARGLVQFDQAVRGGRWSQSRAERPTLSGARAGVIGLGRIGMGIARRAAAFEMSVSYHTRNPRPDVPWRHFAGVRELARESDFLFVACPGGPATRHLVDGAVLEALGPSGYLINIARGSVVANTALVEALQAGRIAGAGLDVIDGEPAIPAELLASDKLLFTPHIAGRSPAALQTQLDMLCANLAARLAGKPVPTPVGA